MRCILILFVAVLVTVASGCDQPSAEGPGTTAKELTVLCGAGIQPAMEPLKAAFEKAAGCKVTVSYEGSGTLLGKLQAGVEADVYLPGDDWFIAKAGETDLIASRRVVAWFVPVIAVQKGNPKGIAKLEDLAREGIAVGLGTPDACAVGNVSKRLLADAGLGDKVKASFEALTVNRLADQLKLKTIDAAILWDATALQVSDAIETVPVEDGNFHAVPLTVGVLKKAKSLDLASQFAEFAAGDAGAACFRAQHYQVPGKTLRVGCGSSMRPPIEDLAALFQERTGCEVLRDYGGSGTVLLQIEESKEGDIYICHDPFAYTCEDKKISERWHTMAHIHAALAVLKGNPKKVKGFSDLLREDLKLGLPHRTHSTRGKILWTMLEKHGLAEAMQKREFFEDRTHGLINQLKLNTVDIAVLWDAPVNAMPEFEAIPIEEKYNVDAITSPTSGRTFSLEHVKVTVVRLNLSKEPLLAAQFARMCLSEAGREILKKHRFALPE